MKRTLAPIITLLVALDCAAHRSSSLSEEGRGGLSHLFERAKAVFEAQDSQDLSKDARVSDDADAIFEAQVMASQDLERQRRVERETREFLRARGERVCEEGEDGTTWRPPGDCNWCRCENGVRSCTKRGCKTKEESARFRKRNREINRFWRGLDPEHQQCTEFYYNEDGSIEPAGSERSGEP